MGVAVLDGFLYAVGGQDGVSCLNYVEKYDPESNKWSKVANMTTRRLGVGVAVLNGCLYAVGGSDGTSPLNTGQLFYKLVLLCVQEIRNGTNETYILICCS